MDLRCLPMGCGNGQQMRLVSLAFMIVVVSPCWPSPVWNDLVTYNRLVEDLENSGTYGYKALQTGENVAPNAAVFDFSDGEHELSGSSSSYCINGPGFFRVKAPDGQVYYTRSGDFYARDGK